ncbi:MAG: YeeE/YedE family protein [Chlamydiales bacterium]|nr:YeeE/YedE family protein [Chlamydiales bacterium]
MENFTPLSAFIGGLIIGLSAVALMYFNQKICGLSGIVEAITAPTAKENRWKLYFVLGMLVGGALLRIFYPPAFAFTINKPIVYVIAAGFLVGFGARLGYGCTSGHGVCGMGRLSFRSYLATALFLLFGIITASAIAYLGGN